MKADTTISTQGSSHTIITMVITLVVALLLGLMIWPG
jgi:hypothetical protein